MSEDEKCMTMSQYVRANFEGFIDALERLKRRPAKSELINYRECDVCLSYGYLIETVSFSRVDIDERLCGVSGREITINRLTPCPVCACSGGYMSWVLR